MTAQNQTKLTTNVYIDGFNLYYGSLKGTAFRWLDLRAFAQALLPNHSVREIYYFTARMKGDLLSEAKQESYWQALSHHAGVHIIEGHFLRHQVNMPMVSPPPPNARVWKTEEKGSDVNLASYLLRDAFLGNAEQFLVITNDSDLATPIRLVREHKLPIGVALPVSNPGRHPSVQLRQVATFVREIRPAALRRAQLPNSVAVGRSNVVKPSNW